MTVTAKDLRFNISKLFELLNRGEEIFITYRGKAKAKLISFNDSKKDKKTDMIFGLWKDRDNINVDDMVREMRKGRSFDI
jgi:antitoxin (DNA-binding transcriptional repressor) of toxin-antitoxin stability system